MKIITEKNIKAALEIRERYFNWDLAWKILYQQCETLNNRDFNELKTKIMLVDKIMDCNLYVNIKSYEQITDIMKKINLDEIFHTKTAENAFEVITI